MTFISRIEATLIAVLLAVMAMAAPARADIFSLGEYQFIAGEEPGLYELIVSLPEAAASARPVIWPQGCSELEASRQSQAGRARLAFTIRCDRPLERGDRIVTPWQVDGASFASSALGPQAARQLDATAQGVVLPIGVVDLAARPLVTVAADFLVQGFGHILGGWDHLAFVLCLCLLARGRDLVWLVTIFTLGHSLSLALAFFELVSVPMPPVEAVIALSIAFMAREALLVPVDGNPDAAGQRRYRFVVAGFGLLHGLGFATALGESGVAHDERIPGLIFFNLGVEAGQLAFVGVVLLVGAVARAVGRGPALRLAALYGAGIVGSFWLVERVAGFASA
jgi:HupE / UreJ protein